MTTVIAAGCQTPPGTQVPSDAREVHVTMHTSAGDIELELDRARAPISVGNFLMHARRGDYDGTCFHRVIPTFVIQGGGWVVDRSSGGVPASRGFTLVERAKLDEAAGRKDVPITNEWTNGLKNVRGTIAMARDAAPDSATREFYINVADNARLDTAREKTGNAGYAVFGRVVRGMEIVDAIKDGATTERPDIISDGEGMKDVPIEPVVIERVR